MAVVRPGAGNAREVFDLAVLVALDIDEEIDRVLVASRTGRKRPAVPLLAGPGVNMPMSIFSASFQAIGEPTVCEVVRTRLAAALFEATPLAPVAGWGTSAAGHYLAARRADPCRSAARRDEAA